MKYKSTRGADCGTSFADALLASYASDGGLFVPESLPMLSEEQLLGWVDLTFPQICAEVVHLFCDDSIPLERLREMTAAAFSGFNGGQQQPPLPLRKLPEGSTTTTPLYLLDASQGPTLAFKDIGQQMMAQLLDHILQQRGRRATILVETSGDTGPAAIAAVQNCANLTIFCMFPAGRVSDVQELQMLGATAAATEAHGGAGLDNVHVYCTDGDTDDQATACKALFADAAFTARHSLISINSINWGRVLVQSSYYVWAYLQLAKAAAAAKGTRADCSALVNFAVPTGAFGNGMGAYLARLLGVPIGRILCATNDNDIVARTLCCGDMRWREGGSVATCSPAMDIQFAYNLERMLYFCSNQHAPSVRRIMTAFEQAPSVGVRLDHVLLHRLQAVFAVKAVSDEVTLDAIGRVWAATWQTEEPVLLCPHSAVGVAAAELALRAPSVGGASGPPTSLSFTAAEARCPTVCVLTAHPAKFPQTVRQAVLGAGAAARAEGTNMEEAVERALQHPSVTRLQSLPSKCKWLRKPTGAAATAAGDAAAPFVSLWVDLLKADIEGASS